MDSSSLGLYMILLGCRPQGRFIEQHDIFFGIADGLPSIIPAMLASWPEAKGKIHIDAWRKVGVVDGYAISIVASPLADQQEKLFFINLGGYQPGYFAEPHYMMLTVAKNKAAAIKRAKETKFYQEMGFKSATSHIDDKYGVDVDDIYEIEDILHPDMKRQYAIKITPVTASVEDTLHLGYLPIAKIK